MAFVPFRNIETGVIYYYPEHFADDPNLSAGLELYDPEAEEYEEDKVVVDPTHVLPVEQRAVTIATPLAELKKDELVKAAEKRELPTTGTKAELSKAIADHDKETS